MNYKDLEVALDRHGGDLDRWPAPMRAEAEALAARDSAAAKLMATAASLDATLAAAMQPMAVDSAFLGRIMAHVGETPHHEVAVRATPRLVAWAGAAMVAFLVTGYAVGATLPQTQDADAFAGLMFGSDTTDTVAAGDLGSAL